MSGSKARLFIDHASAALESVDEGSSAAAISALKQMRTDREANDEFNHTGPKGPVFFQ